MFNARINKAIKEGKVEKYILPVTVSDAFLKHWKTHRNDLTKKGLFVDIKKIPEGIEIMAVGETPLLGIFMVGFTIGVFEKIKKGA